MIFFSVRSNFISLMVTKSAYYTCHVDTPLNKILILMFNSIYHCNNQISSISVNKQWLFH